jgi:hypothetical protein
MDNDRLIQLVGAMVGDLGATIAAGSVVRPIRPRSHHGSIRSSERDGPDDGRRPEEPGPPP